MPVPAMVGAVIQATPEVDEVHYSFSERDNTFSRVGIKPRDQVYAFSYRGGSNVRGSLVFVVDGDGAVEYSQSLRRIGGPPQEWINATRPIMIKIEGGLEKTCGLTNLQTSVEEVCSGVKSK
jgi:hypothetical protein